MNHPVNHPVNQNQVATPSRSLDGWLRHAESVHSVGIDLGLERIRRVAEALGFEPPHYRCAPRCLIVAGTNGKGSTCVAIEALLKGAGLTVGTTLSPHVHRFNERVRIDGRELDDATLCAAFEAVEAARGEVPLTYFEFSALVALHCFRAAAVDVAVLEVGLGGRLDAFNLVSADVAVITSIGLDHQDWLGDDLQVIGREKAGVLRPGQRVVLGADVTESVVHTARELGCRITRLGEDFRLREGRGGWDTESPGGRLERLPWGALAPHNCALAIEAAGHLVAQPAGRVRDALRRAWLPGRMEAWAFAPAERLLLLDVAHNPAGAAFLRRLLEARYPGRRFVGLLGMLADKDAAGVSAALQGLVRAWVCAPTRGPRGLAGAALAEKLAAAGGGYEVAAVGDLVQGLERCLSGCRGDDGILAFGSFSLVEQVRNLLAGGRFEAVPVGPMDLRI